MTPEPDHKWVACVFAHNEAGRIEQCLQSLPLNCPQLTVFVAVNGSSDDTAKIARQVKDRTTENSTSATLEILDIKEGGKARTWNKFVHELAPQDADLYFFLDGDIIVRQGSFSALALTASEDTTAQIVSALPLSGRKAEQYREDMLRNRSVFGGLYMIRGDFLRKISAQMVRLPEDLIGDDGLVESMAKNDLEQDAKRVEERVCVCQGAGFYTEQLSVSNLAHLLAQFQRLIRYSERRFQNMVITEFLSEDQFAGLPARITPLAAAQTDISKIRLHPIHAITDFIALRRIKKRAKLMSLRH